MSVGVNVRLAETVPAPGAVDGVAKLKAPAADAKPPLSVDEASVCP